MFNIISLFKIHHYILPFVTIFVILFNNLGMVLVLHCCLLSWSGSRVFPLSCLLHYPAVSCKSAAILPSYRKLSLLVVHVSLSMFFAISKLYITLHCTDFSEINYLCLLYRLLWQHDLPKYSLPVQIFAAAFIFTFFLGKIKNLTRLISVLSLQFKFVHNHKSCPNSAATLLSP